jgi:chemotaxis protein MotB
MRFSQDEEEGSGASWLTTFNDMMTLLMVFFVLIFSMSTLDLNRTEGLIENLQSALGVMMAGRRVSIAVSDTPPVNHAAQSAEKQPQSAQELQDALRQMQAAASQRKSPELVKLMQELEADPDIQARYSKEGVNLSLENSILFEPGKARINPRGYAVLDKIAAKLKTLPNRIRIEGHTDDVPIATELYPSNWELSVARAVNVLKCLVNAGPIVPVRMSAVGYGDSKPLYSNATSRGRAGNRRVEIILVSEEN